MSGGTINFTPVAEWLTGKAWNAYTQFGEDGLIDACLARVGITNRHCFEIGAADGRFYSNTLRLREQGWHSVLIESDAAQFQKLKTEFGLSAECIHCLAIDLDAVLRTTAISKTPDLGIIDIDGQDYWMWQDLVEYRPRVMLVEIAIVDPELPVPERGGNGQAGLNAIKALGESKGYQLVAHTYCNAVFLDAN